MKIGFNNANTLGFKGKVSNNSLKYVKTNCFQDISHFGNLSKRIKPENINANHSYCKLDGDDISIRVTLKKGASIKMTPTESIYTCRGKKHCVTLPYIDTSNPLASASVTNEELLLTKAFLSLKIKLTNFLLDMIETK